MTIRTKLTLSVTLLFTATLGMLGYSIVRVGQARVKAETLEKTQIIENTVRRAASDALLQRDDILLLSYVKFLRRQFEELTYCNLTWVAGERTRTHHIGAKATTGSVRSRVLRVVDPADKSRQVVLDIGIDESILKAKVDEEVSRMQRDLMRLFGIALLVGILFSVWFARKITRPLGALSEVAGEIGRGKLGVRLEWKSKDEVGELVAGFNHMSRRLEELDVMKKDFISAVTHELRSPLGAIESFLNLMEGKMVGGRPTNPDQFMQYFGRIKTNVKRLSGFISDLLDVAKIERGKMECTLKPIQVQNVAGEVVQFFEAKSREQGVTVSNRLDRQMGPVQGDSERLRQVFVNLIANSLKFTPKGGNVWIQGEQYREEGSKFIEVSVVDTGSGMDDEDRKKLFSKFQQGKNTNSRLTGSRGTGLGLFIVKSIVEAHGGKVSVKSQPGKGTQFLFNLRMV
ncbi:MAG: HAMP domain-containing sensor histidine kinase [Elusimicrobiota bacterium]